MRAENPRRVPPFPIPLEAPNRAGEAMPDLLQSASALRAALLARQFSARELLLATLAAIERIDPGLNAIIETDMDGALRAAQQSDARLSKGNARPLEGLPMTIKDTFEVVGMATTSGAPSLKDYLPQDDAAAVARLRAAGAILLGKTNVPIFAGDFQTYNSVFGTTNNPWNRAYSPGGSSGGAAAAIAAGLGALELGSDLAGSIRWPAHCCGVFGLRPTAGTVSMAGHIPPMRLQSEAGFPTLAVAGPLARSAADLGLALDVLAESGTPDVAANLFVPARKTSAEGLRVAVWLDEPLAGVESDVALAVLRAAQILEGAGARIDARARPGFSFAEAWEVFALLSHAVVGATLPDKTREKIAATAQDFVIGDPSHRALQARGFSLSAADHGAIEIRRRRLREEWARFFAAYDVVLCPPAVAAAIKHDHTADLHARQIIVNGRRKPYLDLMFWACLASGAGLPAAVAPVMLGKDGLPRGVQIIAAAYEDRTAIAVAEMLQAAGPGIPAPPIPYQ